MDLRTFSDHDGLRIFYGQYTGVSIKTGLLDCQMKIRKGTYTFVKNCFLLKIRLLVAPHAMSPIATKLRQYDVSSVNSSSHKISTAPTNNSIEIVSP